MRKLLASFILTFSLLPAFSFAGENTSSTVTPGAAAQPTQALPAQTQVNEDARFKNALDLYIKGEQTAAKEAFQKYLKDFPDGVHADDSLYWLGKYKELRGRYGEALVMLRRAADDFPTGGIAASIQFELGYCLYSPENPERDLNAAFKEFMKVPSLLATDASDAARPDSGRAAAVSQALYYAAKCRMDMNKFAEAKEIFSRVIKEFPGSPYAAPALYGLGRACLIQGDSPGALAAFRTVRARYPAGLYSDKAIAEIVQIESAGNTGAPAKDSLNTKQSP
ncbi:MAG: tetratricopeptide repeat protein [Nitrospirota bacterium]